MRLRIEDAAIPIELLLQLGCLRGYVGSPGMGSRQLGRTFFDVFGQRSLPA